MFFLAALILIISVLAKSLGGKRISDMTSLVSSRLRNLTFSEWMVCVWCCQSLAETKTGFGNVDVTKAAVSLVLVSLYSLYCWATFPVLPCHSHICRGLHNAVIGPTRTLV